MQWHYLSKRKCACIINREGRVCKTILGIEGRDVLTKQEQDNHFYTASFCCKLAEVFSHHRSSTVKCMFRLNAERAFKLHPHILKRLHPAVLGQASSNVKTYYFSIRFLKIYFLSILDILNTLFCICLSVLYITRMLIETGFIEICCFLPFATRFLRIVSLCLQS